MKQLILIALLAFGTAVFAQDTTTAPPDNNGQSAKQDVKDAGHSTKEATKKTAHKTKKETKKGVNKGAEKTKEGAQKVEDKTTPQ